MGLASGQISHTAVVISSLVKNPGAPENEMGPIKIRGHLRKNGVNELVNCSQSGSVPSVDVFFELKQVSMHTSTPESIKS